MEGSSNSYSVISSNGDVATAAAAVIFLLILTVLFFFMEFICREAPIKVLAAI